MVGLVVSNVILFSTGAQLKAETVRLNFFVGSSKVHQETATAGEEYTLSTLISGAGIDMSSYACREYTFSGWKVGSPVQGDETPDMPATITPTHNVNLYAVFENDEEHLNNYVRITQTSNLEADAEYLVICYYVYGGEQQYYALSNIKGTYTYEGINYNRLNSTRLYPRAGVITAPDSSLVWTLKEGAESNSWKWYNEQDHKWLQIGTTAQDMLVAAEGDASSCAITQANGIFTIRNTANDLILKYVDDYITEEEDYFITGTYTDYVIYLYKKESPYTSFPDCDPWTVHLDALDGTIVGTSGSTLDLEALAEADATVTLPEAVMGDGVCDGWTFVGWSIDAPVQGQTDEPTGLIPAGSYEPLYNGVTLYAVYTKGETITKYTKLTTGSTPSDGTYIIVAKNGTEYYAMGNTAGKSSMSGVLSDYYNVAGTSVEVLTSGEIMGQQSTALEWTFSSNRFRNVGNTSVYINPYRSGIVSFTYSILGSSTTLSTTRSDDQWAIYSGMSNLSFSTSHNEFYNYYSLLGSPLYLFKKSVESNVSYTSYPHCVPYTVFLHACGGSIVGDGSPQDATMTQATPSSTITLPAATPACPSEGWEFVGWFPDEDKASFDHFEFTDCLEAGGKYFPIHDSTHLYAVYKRVIERFRIINSVDEIENGDTYLITYYANKEGGAKYYDYILSSQTKGSYLKGIETEAPRDGTGFYIETLDSTEMWTIVKNEENNYWTVQNLDNKKYLRISNTTTSTTNSANEIYLADKADTDWAIHVKNSSNYYIYCESEEFRPRNTTMSSGAYPHCYIYRRMKEFSSWPHCEPFTVTFDACGGTTEAHGSSKTEPEVYAGVELPDAYVSTDCAKEGWTFAGWCTMPIDEETDLLSFELFPAGTVYHPLSTRTTLYAVYFKRTDHFKRISTAGRLHAGVNYIIATSDNKALSNVYVDPADPTKIAYKTIAPNAAYIVTNDNDSIEWRLEGVKGEYILHNLSRDVYLDLSEPGQAQLTPSTATDNFDITYDGASYRVRSCISIAHRTGEKYLGTNPSGTYFTALKDTMFASTYTYLYRQQATYYSYPVCTEDIDVIKWSKVDEDYNSVVVESYHLKGAPDVHGSIGEPEKQSDGTYLIQFPNTVLRPCTQATVEWDGVTSRLRIPYIVSEDMNSSAFLTAAADCSECDVYIEPDVTLTVNETDTIRKITVTNNATLNIANDRTLSVNIMSLYSVGDQSAPIVNFNTGGSIVLRYDELFYDLRLDESRYYWFSLPYDAMLKEISFVNEAANDGAPVYRGSTSEARRFFVKYYNGTARAEDSGHYGSTNTYWMHVAAKGADYTLKAGLGYNVGIGNQSTVFFNGQDYTHSHRTLRFTMRPDKAIWLGQERAGGATKATDITPSTAERAIDAGWNLIGNPYLHDYRTGEIEGNSHLYNGYWKKILNRNGDWTGGWEAGDEKEAVPYLTIYDAGKRDKGDRYSQVLASGYTLRPFEAVFIQANTGSTINFTEPASVTASPVRKRRQETDEPLYTGIMLSGNGRVDRTGVVLGEQFTPAYEIGGDLAKMVNDGGLNLYTMDAENQLLAFHALSDEDAQTPIPVGVIFHETGDYTFAFDAAQYNASALDTVLLKDLQTGIETNLLMADYSFETLQKGAVNDRFELLIRRAKAPQITTVLDNTTDSRHIRKIIRDGKLFIVMDDAMYNAVGTKIK